MKNLPAFLIVFFLFSIAVFGQVDSPCPAIAAHGPRDLPTDESPYYTFRVTVTNADTYKLSYRWYVSMGTIVSGERSAVMNLKVEIGSTPTATVDISGLPQNCPKTVSATANIDIPPPLVPILIDEFVSPIAKFEISRFDGLVTSLKTDPVSEAGILEKFRSGTSRVSAEKRVAKLVAYLKSKDASLDRVSLFVTVSNEANLTQLWVRPNGARGFPFEKASRINLRTFRRDLRPVFPVNQ